MSTRLLLAMEAAVFDLAAMIHAGVLMHGYEHARARNAEAIIGAVLLVGLLLTAIVPARLRPIALLVQVFALVGTLVGLFTIAIGVGPRSVLDVTLHATMVTLLAYGLLMTRRRMVNA
jgi:hypothetical protein